MALIDRVAQRAAARSIERADPVTLEEFGYLLGRGQGVNQSRSGVTVGPTRALGITAWWRGVNYLSTNIASLPVHTYRDNLGGERSRRANPPWVRRPDVELPWFGLVEHWMMSVLHRGNGYAFKIRNSDEQVMGLRALHPDRMRVGQASDGTKVFQIDGRQDIGFTTREVLHIPGLSYNGVIGLDPISVHAEGLGLTASADEFAARSYSQGTHLQAYLSIPQELSQEQSDRLKAQWERFHKGMANAHEFGVLGNGAEYKTLSLNPEQAQLLETRKFNVTEIARMLGVVPHKLYDLERATFSNIEHQAIESVMDSIRPWVERFEEWINFDPDLLREGNFIELQLEGLLRGDTESRYRAHASAITAGWMTPATAARIENQPAPKELEYYLRPLNMDILREGEQPTLDDPTKKAALALDVGLAAQRMGLAVKYGVVSQEESRKMLPGIAGPPPPMPTQTPAVPDGGEE